MKKHYILIDYENVQTKSLSVLQGAPNQEFQIMVFVGANQSKIPIELVSSMQSFGNKAKYVQITGSGRNALDFHIAYYLGTLTEREPKAIFHVISKDTGYDQLIKHLKGKRIDVARQKDLFDIPWLSSANKKPADEQLDAIVKNLSARGPSRPRKVKTLKNSINSLFDNKLGPDKIDGLVKDLQERKYIVIKQENVTYRNM
ncbi:MAG: PIN domain-containing protein [Thiotrichales bacterium]|nr:PIN domain-containing protein [Thiotrichales bacterium]